MASIDSMLPEIHAEIPKLPDLVARRALMRSAREFAEFTRAIRQNIVIDTVANTPVIDLSSLLTTDHELVDVVTMQHVEGARPLQPITYDQLDSQYPNWRTQTATRATRYVRAGNSSIRLVYTPSETEAAVYNIRVALKPTLNATVLDDLVLNKFDEIFIHGALHRLFRQPNKMWTSEGAANGHFAIYMAGLDAAKAEASDEYQHGVARKVRYGGY